MTQEICLFCAEIRRISGAGLRDRRRGGSEPLARGAFVERKNYNKDQDFAHSLGDVSVYVWATEPRLAVDSWPNGTTRE